MEDELSTETKSLYFVWFLSRCHRNTNPNHEHWKANKISFRIAYSMENELRGTAIKMKYNAQ